MEGAPANAPQCQIIESPAAQYRIIDYIEIVATLYKLGATNIQAVGLPAPIAGPV